MKLSFLVLAIGLTSISVTAQNISKSPSVSIGLQVGDNLNGNNLGTNGSVNVLFPTSSQINHIPNYWIGSLKLSQLSINDRGFFQSFDKQSTLHLSILSLTVGYRLGLGKANYFHKPYEPASAFYLEGNAGVAFVGEKKTSPTFALNFGYNISKHFDVNTSGQWMKDYDKSNIWITGIGGAYTF